MPAPWHASHSSWGAVSYGKASQALECPLYTTKVLRKGTFLYRHGRDLRSSSSSAREMMRGTHNSRV